MGWRELGITAQAQLTNKIPQIWQQKVFTHTHLAPKWANRAQVQL